MIEVKSATLSDVALINSLAEAIFEHTYKSILSPEQLAFMFDMMYAPVNIEKQMADGHHYHIAEQDGEPCGYVAIRQKGDNFYYIEKIYTLPSVHGTGVGRKLFEFACEYAKSRCTEGRGLLELNVNRNNARAISFYKKMGMHADRQTDEHVGGGFYANDYVMAIEL